MSTIAIEKEIINVRIAKSLKNKAQKYSSKLGISLSTFIKLLIKNAIEEDSLVLSLSDVTKKKLKEADIRLQKGEYSGPFDNAQDLIKSLRSK